MSLEQASLQESVARDRHGSIEDLLDAPVADRLHRLSASLGLPLSVFDAETNRVVAATVTDGLWAAPPGLVRQCAQSGEARILAAASGLTYFALPLSIAETSLIAVGYALARPGLRPADLVVAAADRGWGTAQLDLWISRQRACDPELVHRLVALADRDLRHSGREDEISDDYARIAQQLDYTYEEIKLLHTLTQSMHLSRSPRDLAQLSLERTDAVIHAEGHVIWLDDKRDGRLFLIQGRIPFDEMGMARLIARFDGHDWPRPLVRNHVAGTLLGADFPGLRNFALVAVADGGLRFGWILSCNRSAAEQFGSVQTGLLSSVASILATHQHNLELYRQHEDLLLSFVRSLVSTLDAKDAYTRGHSERVALVARRLGSVMGLPVEDLRDIYLAGLLHDIGKIGLDDQILRKAGPLTHSEFEQVKRHPVVGYNILAGLKNLHAVLPGVRHHHEAYSGTGYPDGLSGEGIPLMARIIAVADSYDAMRGDRPYRTGLGLERLEQILSEGAGVQWDARVVAAYFSVRDEIRMLCDTYTPSDGSLLREPAAELELLVQERNPLRAIDGIRSALGRVADL